jgi:hypothetical protein
MAKKDYKSIEKDTEAFEKHKFNYVKNALRIATYKWPYFSLAMSRQRIERGMYKCESCSGIFGPKEINRDHIEPVIAITGWTNWQDYINRLFVKSDGIQILCITCHSSKTQVENQMRIKYGQKPIKTLTKKKKRRKISK